MIVNLHTIQVVNDDLDLFKSITRSQAKGVHKDLPEGGVWRTMKGHHIYIKDGKVLAGAIPGVKGAKKATKEHLKEHQATIDKEAKKNTKEKTPAKTTKTGAGKSEVSKKPKKTVSGVSSSAKPKSTSGSKPKSTTKPKATKSGAKAPSKTKKVEPKLVINTKPKDTLQSLAEKSKRASDFATEVMNHPNKDLQKEMFENLKKYPHKEIALEEHFNDLKGIKKEEAPTIDQPKKKAKTIAQIKAEKQQANEDHWTSEMEEVREMANGDMSMFSYMMKYKEPTKLYNAVKDYMKKTKKTEREVAKEIHERNQPKVTPSEDHDIQDGLTLYHGTAITKVDSILKSGFKPNGGHSDFGNCAYFKSPAYDPLDEAEHKAHVADRQAKGMPVPHHHLQPDYKGYDSRKVVGFFADRKNPAVIHATIDRSHVLDCTKGRPKELQNVLNDFDKHSNEGKVEAMMGFILKHGLGINVGDTWDDETIQKAYNTFQEKKPELDKWWGRDLKPFKVSPYEVYAKKTGIKAIVDKLPEYTDEGWQIGVFDPSIIKINDVGKGLNLTDKGVELLKALIKALRKSNPGYTLLHHEIDKDGHLHLHVGAEDDRDALEKSLGDIQAFMRGFTV